jgi:hypothetical protein
MKRARQPQLTDGDVGQCRKRNACTGDQQSLRTTRQLLNERRTAGLMAVGRAVEGGAGAVGGWFVPDFYL